MTTYDSQAIAGRHVLDGNVYRSCRFNNCELVYQGGGIPSITHSQFSGAVSFHFDGAAGRTLAFMKALQAGGFAQFVEPTLDAIRNASATPTVIGSKAKERTTAEDKRHQSMASACPLELFRFFDKAEYADDFVRGQVWISTLEACRGYEKAGQGDKGEGTMSYWHGPVSHGHPHFETVAQRMGLQGLGHGSAMAFNTVSWFVPDAFVLCCTRRYDPAGMSGTFGRHCVRIHYPLFVLERLAAAIEERRELARFFMGPIQYSDRHFRDTQPPPAPHAALIKPSDGYVHQQEERMIWLPANRAEKLAPFKLIGPALSDFCERIA